MLCKSMLVTASMWGSGFFSTARSEACIPASSSGRFTYPLAHVADGAGKEPAGAARRIEQGLARFRVDHPGHERGHGARRVVLARVCRPIADRSGPARRCRRSAVGRSGC